MAINLTKISERVYVDLTQVSFIDLEMKQDTVGPAYMRAKVIIAGHLVIMNVHEATSLLEAMRKEGYKI